MKIEMQIKIEIKMKIKIGIKKILIFMNSHRIQNHKKGDYIKKIGRVN